MNKIIIGLLLLSVSLTIVPSSINAQKLYPNEANQQLYQQQYPNSGLTIQDFENFMQFMNYYMALYGPNWQDQVIKIYEDDDDDDDDDDHDHDNKRDWKKWFDKHNHNDKKGNWKGDKDRDDKKKYCEGKGKWNGHKCVTNNEKDKAAWEDAVCDDGKKSKFCGNDKRDRDDDDDYKDITEHNRDADKSHDGAEEEASINDDPEDADSSEEENDDNDESKDDDDDSGGDDSDNGGGDDSGNSGEEN